MRTRFDVLVIAAGVMLFSAAGWGQGPLQELPPLGLDSITGRDSFERHCAACHGSSGKGDGPVTQALRSDPPDLTTLTRRNGGTFPRSELAAFIEGTGRSVPAHGTGDMPVWGPIFRAFDRSDARVRVRIQNLVAYVESLQLPAEAAPQAAALSGQQLFQAYCASCHGTDGRGAGPVSEALREVPPDLTTFTIQNNGVFPSERVRRIIDGRDVPAHGTTDMPVWGRVFMREPGGDPDVARTRIDAIVQYLESIQQRRL